MAATPDFGKILTRSKDLTLKNKWLWVYGMVLAAFSGVSYSNYSSNVDTKDLEQKIPSDIVATITNWLSIVPVQTWVALALGILLAVFVGVIVSYVATSFAKGALIAGIKEADDDKNVDLGNTAKNGFKNLKNLIVFNLLNGLIGLGIFCTLFIVYVAIGFVFNFAQFLMAGWLILAGILMIFTLIILAPIMVAINIYAERLIVLKNFSPLNAWKKALSLSKGNFLNTIIMGLINSTVGCFVGCGTSLIILIIIAIPAIIFALPLFGGFNLISIFGIGLCVLAYIYANFLVRGIMMVFNYSNWNLLFKEIYAD